MEHTPALDEKIREKSEKLKKYLSPNAEVSWVCWVENSDQIAEIKIHDKKHDFIAKASSDDLYKALDLVISKISNQFQHLH